MRGGVRGVAFTMRGKKEKDKRNETSPPSSPDHLHSSMLSLQSPVGFGWADRTASSGVDDD